MTRQHSFDPITGEEWLGGIAAISRLLDGDITEQPCETPVDPERDETAQSAQPKGGYR